MSKRFQGTTPPDTLRPGDIEYEMGIPIPGVILEKSQWVQTAIKKLPSETHLCPSTIFGRRSRVAIEIGCGNGRFAISSAVRRPDWDHLAIDILPAVIRYATRRGNQRGLQNLRFMVCDGWRFLEQYIESESVDEIHIYHPQPYSDPTKSHRRMLTPEFVGLMHSRLATEGRVFLQTDRAEYWRYIEQVMPKFFAWQSQTDPWPEDPHGRSRRELLSMDQGLRIHRGVGIKLEVLSEDAIKSIVEQLPQPQFRIHDNRRRRRHR